MVRLVNRSYMESGKKQVEEGKSRSKPIEYGKPIRFLGDRSRSPNTSCEKQLGRNDRSLMWKDYIQQVFFICNCRKSLLIRVPKNKNQEHKAEGSNIKDFKIKCA